MSVLTYRFIRYSLLFVFRQYSSFCTVLSIAYKNIVYPFLKQDNQIVLLLSERSHSDSPGRSWMVMLQTQNVSFMPLSGTFPANIYGLQKLVVIIIVNVYSMFDVMACTSFHSS